jgi:hypothetical protein
MHRTRLPAALLAASLGVGAGGSAGLGAVPISTDGQIGTFTIPDSSTTAGVACTYDAGGPGDQGNDIDLMVVKGPRVFARDRSSERDRQIVGVKVIYQRSADEGGSGGWVNAATTNLVKRVAFDDQAATFRKKTWVVPMEEDYHFRAVAKIVWFKPGTASQKQGETKQRYVFYRVNQGGPQGVEQDRCLPEP